MKSVIFVGGKNTRLYPMTKVISKQLLPIYDKLLIYYLLSMLLLENIQDILIISMLEDIGTYERLLGDSSRIGIKLSYAVQDNPLGVASALIVGEKFVGSKPVCLILGNNKPENLLDFVQILSEELVRAGVLPPDFDFEAHKELVPMQPGDVPITYADVSALERDFGFKPNTGLREGLRRFAEWYKAYYNI